MSIEIGDKEAKKEKSWQELNKYQKIASGMSVILGLILVLSPFIVLYITRIHKIADQTILISGLAAVIFAVSSVVISMIGNRKERREKERKGGKR